MQADLNIRCARISKGTFSDVAAHEVQHICRHAFQVLNKSPIVIDESTTDRFCPYLYFLLSLIAETTTNHFARTLNFFYQS